MKRVLIEVPDNVDSSMICYRSGDEYVKANVVRSAHFSTKAISFSDSGMEELSKRIKEFAAEAVMPLAPMSPPSRKEFEALRSRVEKLETMREEALALLTTSYQPSAEEGLKIVGCSDKDVEEIRSRVEKLEHEAERQCARVIKMEEGISDDLK